jgi:hypothetical protein
MGVLDELLNEGETFSYNDDSFDAVQENFRLKGFGKQLGSPVIRHAPTQQSVMPHATGQQPFVVGQRPGVPSAKAQFDITIKRLEPFTLSGVKTNNYGTEDLPIILFQSSQLKSHYKRSISYRGNYQFLGIDGGTIINPYIPLVGADGSVPNTSGLSNYRTDGYRFIYLDFDNTNNSNSYFHTILITCPQVDYPTLVSALESDIIRINYIKYFIPSSAESAQFNRRFDFIEMSQFGKQSNNNVPVLSNIKSNDFKDRLIEIPVNFYVDKTKGLLLEIAPEMTNKEIVLSLFVDYTNRQSV